MNGEMTIVIAIASPLIMAGMTIGILKADTRNIKDNLKELQRSFNERSKMVEANALSIGKINTRCEERHKYNGHDRRKKDDGGEI